LKQERDCCGLLPQLAPPSASARGRAEEANHEVSRRSIQVHGCYFDWLSLCPDETTEALGSRKFLWAFFVSRSSTRHARPVGPEYFRIFLWNSSESLNGEGSSSFEFDCWNKRNGICYLSESIWKEKNAPNKKFDPTAPFVTLIARSLVQSTRQSLRERACGSTLALAGPCGRVPHEGFQIGRNLGKLMLRKSDDGL